MKYMLDKVDDCSSLKIVNIYTCKDAGLYLLCTVHIYGPNGPSCHNIYSFSATIIMTNYVCGFSGKYVNSREGRATL